MPIKNKKKITIKGRAPTLPINGNLINDVYHKFKLCKFNSD